MRIFILFPTTIMVALIELLLCMCISIYEVAAERRSNLFDSSLSGNAAPPSFSSLRFVSTLTPSPAVLQPQCKEYEKGYDYAGDDLGNWYPAKSVSECCLRCTETVGCNAWTWHNYSSNDCFLKSSAAGRTKSYPNCISGVAHGPSPPPPPPPSPLPPPSLPAAIRAAQVLGNMTQSEKLLMVHGSPGPYIGNENMKI